MKRGLSTGDITNALSDENGDSFTQPKNVRKRTKKAPNNASTQCNSRNRSQSQRQTVQPVAATETATASAIGPTR